MTTEFIIVKKDGKETVKHFRNGKGRSIYHSLKPRVASGEFECAELHVTHVEDLKVKTPKKVAPPVESEKDITDAAAAEAVAELEAAKKAKAQADAEADVKAQADAEAKAKAKAKAKGK